MQENTNHVEQRPDDSSRPAISAQQISTSLPTAEGTEPQAGQSQGPGPITLEDLLEFPRQVLPEQTYTHLMNAGREARLAFVSLFNNLSDNFNSMKGNSGESKVRKHIDVE